MPGPAPVLVSVADAYRRAAQLELRDALPGSTTQVLGPDLLLLDGAGDVADVADRCRRQPVVFARHLARADVEVSGRELPSGAVAAAVDLAAGADGTVGVQVWVSGDAPHRAESVRITLDGALRDAGIATARGGQDQVLGLVVHDRGAHVGLTPAAAMLSDWPGGRMWLRKGPDQVSRAEFKLEELWKVFPIELTGRRALDLGAAPGGWTRVLRVHGFEVWAVDPAPLDGRLSGDAAIHHVTTTAGRFLEDTTDRFDLLVNDMRMPPQMSCGLVVDAADRLARGALAVVTLKITPPKALATVRSSLKVLRRRYDVVFARQLFHNRHEVTVVGRRRA